MFDAHRSSINTPMNESSDLPSLTTTSLGHSFASGAEAKESTNTTTSTRPLESKRTESLPFTIRAVNARRDVERAAKLRQTAYSRHLPDFAEKLGGPEVADALDDTVVLLAESKLDGTPLATMRIHTNFNKPLPMEQAISLPKHLQQESLAEAVRLAIVPGREGHLPRDAIFKAFYLACKALHVDWMVICARHPLDKRYQTMYFEDVSHRGVMVPLPYAADIPHRALHLRVSNVEPYWRDRRHPLYGFFFKIHHPDIEDFTVSCRELAQRILEKKSLQTNAAALH